MDEDDKQFQESQSEELIHKNIGWKEQFSVLIKLFKYLVVVLFVVAPFVGFWLGMEFQKGASEIKKLQIRDTIEKETNKKSDDVAYEKEILSDWDLYQNDEFGFAFRYPKEWELSVKDKRDGNNNFSSIAGYAWREPSSVLEIRVVDPLEYDNRFIVRYKKNELDRIVLREGDSTYDLQLTGGIKGTVYENKGAVVPDDSSGEYDVFIVRYEGDLLELSPPGKFNDLYKKVASTISFISKNPINSLAPIDIVKSDLILYFNNLYECSSAKDEWKCFDEDLNISEKEIGQNPRVYDVTVYKEGRVFTFFSDITGDGHDDATVMIYYKRFSSADVYKQSVFVLTRDFSITGDPERDIFILYLNEVGSRGQSVRGFNEIVPLEFWVNGTLDIGSPNYGSPTSNPRPCNQLVWNDERKIMSSLRVECR